MNNLRTPLMWTLRITMLIQLVVGILLWMGHAANLTPLHMGVGSLFTLAFLGVVAVAAKGGAPAGAVAGAVVLGLLIPVFGMKQTVLLVGPMHWIIRIVHLLIAMAAMGVADQLLKRAKVATA